MPRRVITLQWRSDERGQKRGDAKARQFFGNAPNRFGMRGKVIAERAVELQVNQTRRNDAAMRVDGLCIGRAEKFTACADFFDLSILKDERCVSEANVWGVECSVMNVKHWKVREILSSPKENAQTRRARLSIF